MDNTNTPTTSIDTLPEIDLGKYKTSPQFEEWRRLYLDKTNKVTFGNATQSTLIAYSLDRETQYGSARVIGHENITKLNNLQSIIQDYLSDNGWTLPVFMAHALKMMSDPKVKTTHWWKEIMVMAGYRKEKADIAIQNNQMVINNVQVTPEEARAFENDFTDFIKAKAKDAPVLNPDAPKVAAG